ncbi:DUF4861 domain-containing protein [Algoriphagus sp. D3-2-R+10]|uniref:DUF4861 domain-containing protein n=1 Tax=Algoriphagus aurantiacus TaxID=3103948 RepID=UPI002B37C624|nr:DUF4861 domain-containing protein [Algoriphagus sp. D3-2-R+10]MEB2777777.1 DUF4861 domain-containing protein [Algoriphagus sp. D3-2-R+10]
MIQNPIKSVPVFKRILPSCAIVLLSFALPACQSEVGSKKDESATVITMTVENPLDFSRKHSLIHIDKEKLKSDVAQDYDSWKVVINGTEIPSQWNTKGPEMGLTFVLPEIEAHQKLDIEIRNVPASSISPYTKLTQAELSHKFGGEFKDREYLGGHFENVDLLHVPAEHTDHSWFIRYEGPGWESDLVGYRFYLDWRNGIDVFGKKVNTPVLQNVGQDGFDSYHEPADWGMDVLKVGKTLGLGSIATWEDGKARRVDVTDSLYAEIISNGPVYSAVFTKYSGWDLPDVKTDILSTISIHSGTRLSRMDLESTHAIANFATGLIKDNKAEVLKSDGDLAYSYLATYGPQSLAEDKLGIAVIYPTGQLTQATEDELSHVLVFDGSSNKLSYFFLAAWEQEPEGITSQEEFKKYLDHEILKLSNPLKIALK